ncbi:MAG: hypothetical protein K0R59_2177 [Sphingobacterium sp.]|jgi:hypothetical protein|uniref:DUF4270 family protein n=1 Tax=Sphingobacterium sp. CZ-UAM TaxID=1933868 RepID=UPI000984E508|nr:DUF4270 family protein [Sphingobacterium sp. CZ-UAM]MDF2516881.1 hypothetical protein [Sphingobacterium sp.]OOG17513.1 hypothetical protein BWD42_15065 [Sphingobacterium sp. CZ-UAM]
MIKNFKRRSIQFLLPLFTLAAFVGCNKDISLSLDNSRNETIGVVPIDTVSVKVSTYQLDPLPTSNTGTVLVGKNSNAVTGSVKSTSYLRLGIGTINGTAIPEDAVLDSVSLVLSPNKYYYGDTTKIQKIAVHRVTEDITLTPIDPTQPAIERPFYVTTPSIFSNKKLAYESTPLAELSFNPRVKSTDSLFFKFNSSISNELFRLIKNGDNRIQNNTSFQEYFKGLALVPDKNNTTLIGFTDTVFLQVHYSFENNEGNKVSSKQSFAIDNKAYQYNQIEADRSATKFAAMTIANPQIDVEKTDGNTFLEGSSGVVAKIEFPTLLSLVNDPTISINKVELVIEAENNPLEGYAQPENLVLMIANSEGTPVSALASLSGDAQNPVQSAPLIKIGDANGKYTFNLIDYLNKIKTTAYKNTSLYLSLPPLPVTTRTASGATVVTPSQLSRTADRLILAKDGNDPRIKLNILYTKFQ